jgi:integrase
MALVKRGKTWHTHFFVDGQRYRQSLETSDWREAQAREKALIAQASQGKLTPAGQRFSRLNLNEALDRYLEDRAARVTTRSHRSESDHAKPLREGLGGTPVSRITAEAILGYIRERKAKGISNTTVNMETGPAKGPEGGKAMALRRRRNTEIPHLPERRDIGRALTPDEKLRLLRIAASRPEWKIAYLASVLALNTTMRGCELKQLRWRDVNLIDRTATVQRSKTAAGERVIPLNYDSFTALLRLRERARLLFGDSCSRIGTCSHTQKGRATQTRRSP